MLKALLRWRREEASRGAWALGWHMGLSLVGDIAYWLRLQRGRSGPLSRWPSPKILAPMGSGPAHKKSGTSRVKTHLTLGLTRPLCFLLLSPIDGKASAAASGEGEDVLKV